MQSDDGFYLYALHSPDNKRIYDDYEGGINDNCYAEVQSYRELPSTTTAESRYLSGPSASETAERTYIILRGPFIIIAQNGTDVFKCFGVGFRSVVFGT